MNSFQVKSSFYGFVLTFLILSMPRAAYAEGEQGFASQCFQGSLILDQNNKIKLAESWAKVQVTPCKGRTTPMEPTTMEPTTVEPTTMQLTTMELTTMELTTMELASTTTTSTTSTNEPLTSTDMITNGTSQPPAQTDKTDTGRKRRAAAVSPEMEDKFYCQVFYYPNDDSPKLTVGSTSTLDFSCTQEPDSDCLDGSAADKTIDGKTGKLYCCKNDSCNAPSLVTSDSSNSVEVETLSRCDHYSSKGVTPVLCLYESHLCVNYTINEVTSYYCGDKQTESHCIEDNWYVETCSAPDARRGTICCNLPEVPPEDPTMPTISADPTTDLPTGPTPDGHSQVATVLICVTVAFVVGATFGCVLLVVVQKKCKKRPAFDDMMDFSYSRFQSAESGADDLEL